LGFKAIIKILGLNINDCFLDKKLLPQKVLLTGISKYGVSVVINFPSLDINIFQYLADKMLQSPPENERNLRLNKNLGEFDYDLLVQFDESFLKDIGFDSDKLDGVFEKEGSEKNLRPRKKLEKLDVEVINVTKAMPMT